MNQNIIQNWGAAIAILGILLIVAITYAERRRKGRARFAHLKRNNGRSKRVGT